MGSSGASCLLIIVAAFFLAVLITNGAAQRVPATTQPPKAASPHNERPNSNYTSGVVLPWSPGLIRHLQVRARESAEQCRPTSKFAGVVCCSEDSTICDANGLPLRRVQWKNLTVCGGVLPLSIQNGGGDVDSDSRSTNMGYCPTNMTMFEARSHCGAAKMRLCSAQEIADNVTLAPHAGEQFAKSELLSAFDLGRSRACSRAMGGTPVWTDDRCEVVSAGIGSSAIGHDYGSITASSYSPNHPPRHARLNSATFWVPRAGARAPHWIAVDLGGAAVVSSLAVRGTRRGWVTQFRLEAKTHTGPWWTVGVFKAVKGFAEADVITLEEPVYATHVRLVVQTFHTAVTLQLELYLTLPLAKNLRSVVGTSNAAALSLEGMMESTCTWEARQSVAFVGTLLRDVRETYKQFMETNDATREIDLHLHDHDQKQAIKTLRDVKIATSDEPASDGLHVCEFDFVVLVDHFNVPATNPETTEEYLAKTLRPAMKNCDTRVVLIENWATQRRIAKYPVTQEKLGMLERVVKGVERYKATLLAEGDDPERVVVAPVGHAFLMIYAENRLLWEQLYESDGIMPSRLGSYLAALVIFSSLNDLNPVGLVKQDKTLCPETAARGTCAYLELVARRVVLEDYYELRFGTARRVCRRDCVVSDFGLYSPCDATCGDGTRVRYRRILQPAAPGGRSCPAVTQGAECTVTECSQDCRVSEWTSYRQCEVSSREGSATNPRVCGSGTQRRTRSILEQPRGAGAQCPILEEWRECSVTCDVDCEVTQWSHWSTCSQPCGGGTSYRTRSVATANQGSGVLCPPLVEVKSCNELQCPNQCGNITWQPWSNCSQKCGFGVRTRLRAPDPAAPAMFNASVCPGATDMVVCNVGRCSCTYGPWSGYSKCEGNCPEGVQRRLRHRLSGDPTNCFATNETRSCATGRPSCTKCAVGNWTAWSKCSEKCGGGVKRRSRTSKNSRIVACDDVLLTSAMACETQRCPRKPNVIISDMSVSEGVPLLGWTVAIVVLLPGFVLYLYTRRVSAQHPTDLSSNTSNFDGAQKSSGGGSGTSTPEGPSTPNSPVTLAASSSAPLPPGPRRTLSNNLPGMQRSSTFTTQYACSRRSLDIINRPPDYHPKKDE